MSRVAAYGAAALAFAYAPVSLYWAFGGRGLVSTVGGYVQSFAHQGGAGSIAVAAAATLAKVAGGLLALALVRPWGAKLPRRWLLGVAFAAGALLVVYGAANVLGGVLVLNGVIHPSGVVLRNDLRWHAEFWDLWFLVWGALLAVATVGAARRPGPSAPLTRRVPSVPWPK